MMKNKIISGIESSRNLYNRLILIVGPPYSGKTPLLREISQEINAKVLNVNLELSQYLIDMSHRERMMNARNALYEIIQNKYAPEDIVLLDNTEILFDTELALDPLRHLQELARQRCIVATWNGIIEDDSLIYGQIGHREYRKYNSGDIITFTLDKHLSQ